ncbi:hypothetical protein FA09DRAFT_339711 [Tilletiopsis washingtonensis]|uniref:TMEM14-domain-containing protein n=1 Tax=Tilletiopsis washingtonensis TaxID=58919 RepID=A0A316Z626_9BASI|nr:hypothetical protein FA09DRAFT_339711 [Tilletiopsis washingtonensis]PWN97237.1 hypothetical protein FA09DRAFT_339711 [Tilletiopsis washingtonensis]
MTMAALCGAGGLFGYTRTRSVPSLVAGLGVGALYAYSAQRMRTGQANGHELALGASAVLLASSVPRIRAGPVPLGLAVASAAAGAYYGKQVYDYRV